MFASVINHGSAAVAQTTAGLPPSAAGSLEHTQPPSAASVTQAATGSLGTIGPEYPSPAFVRPGYGASPAPRAPSSAAASAASMLGVELSDDSLTMSPEQLFARTSVLKRGGRVRGYSAKRVAVSLPRGPRKASPSPAGSRRAAPAAFSEQRSYDLPRERGPPAMEGACRPLKRGSRSRSR